MKIGHPLPLDVNIDDIKKLETRAILRSHRNQQALGRKSPLDVLSCAWSPCGRHLAWVSGIKTVTVVPVENDHPNNKDSVMVNCGWEVWSVAIGYGGPATDHPIAPRMFSYPGGEGLSLITGLGNGRIRIYSLSTGQMCLELMDHIDPVVQVTLSPGGSSMGCQLASSSYDGTTKFWDMDDLGNMYHTAVIGKRPSTAATHAWAPDSVTLATGGEDKQVVILRVREGDGCRRTVQMIHMLSRVHHAINSVSFSPDGTLIAAASCDTKLHVWLSQTGQKILALGHLFPAPSVMIAGGFNNAHVTGVCFSPDGRHIATICEDMYIRVWDIENPYHPVFMYDTDVLKPLTCKFHPNGKTLMVGTDHGTVLLLKTLRELCSLKYNTLLNIQKWCSQNHLLSLPLPTALQHYLKIDL